MKRILLLIDYKGHFGSRYDAVPYRSGFDLDLVKELFHKSGFTLEIIEMAKAKQLNNVENIPVLYTSSEDIGYHYKSFIEDIVYYLELKGAIIIPAYKFLKANNNKVFMELLRDVDGFKWGNKLKSWCYGTLEELKNDLSEFEYPIVIKTAQGAMSRGVSLAKNEKDLIKKVKQIARSRNIKMDTKDKLRPYKHKNYKTESLYRNKFILQSFIPGLKNDWKILVFGDKYFILTRHIAKGDFRASGSHVNYLAGSKAILPKGLLDYAKFIYDSINVPHLSIDVVYDGTDFHLIEFQALYFGTSTINLSDVFFEKDSGQWGKYEIQGSVENFYVDSVICFLQKK